MINQIISESSESAQRGYMTITRLGGEGNVLGIVNEFKFDYTYKWYMHNLESVPENKTVFLDTNGSSNVCQSTIPYENNKKKSEFAE